MRTLLALLAATALLAACADDAATDAKSKMTETNATDSAQAESLYTPDPDDPLYGSPPLPEDLQRYDDGTLSEEERQELLELTPEELAELEEFNQELEGLLGGLDPDALIMDPDAEIDPDKLIDLDAPALPPAPDYSDLPPRAEREARLIALFERLGTEEDTERAKLISEEIWALWMDSGSDSVNYLFTRADEAQRKGRKDQARRLIDRMTGLEPDFAEAYARSARLALDEENYGRAITDATEALIREPRHFYALWTLGNTLERLGRKEEALAVYEEAHKLFPKLGGVAERRDALRSEVLGDVL